MSVRARRSGRSCRERVSPVGGAPLAGGLPPRSRARAICRRALRAVFAVALAVLWAGTALADREDGELRLQGDTLGQGRVEIYHDDKWGAVCDDFWGLADAKVACRQLGYPGATAALRELSGPTNISVWLDNMNCSGSEARLADCDGSGWGPHNPHHCSTVGEHAGVQCTLSASSAAVLIAPRPVVVDEQTSATYQVWLAKAPTGEVTVEIGVPSGTDVSLDKTSLTFTTGNWDEPQTVTGTVGTDVTADPSTLEAGVGLQVELGYGLRPPVGHGAFTPYTGFSMAGNGGERNWRIGTRWNAEPAFALALEASRGETDADPDPTTAATIRASLRW